MAITVRADPGGLEGDRLGPAKSIHAAKRFIYNERGETLSDAVLRATQNLLSNPAFTDAFPHH